MFIIDQAFKDSFVRVSKAEVDGMDFLQYFYSIFVQKSDRIARMFENTSIDKQKLLLKKSLTELLKFYEEKHVNQHLLTIGRIHAEDKLNVSPQMYDLWLDTLIETIQKFDPQYHPKIELAWRVTLSPGITYMKFAHKHPNLL